MSDTESLKIHEAHENAELAHAQKALAPVSMTMAILAVLTAAISLMGHRSHNEVVLAQVRANFQKAELVGKSTEQHADAILIEMLGVMSTQSSSQGNALREKLQEETRRYAQEQLKVGAEEQKLEHESERARREANRLDMGELFCEMALVLCSITLLTRQRWYWYAGIIAASMGVVVALTRFWPG